MPGLMFKQWHQTFEVLDISRYYITATITFDFCLIGQFL